MPTATSLASVTSHIKCDSKSRWGDMIIITVPTTTASATSVWYSVPVRFPYGTIQQLSMDSAGTSANWAIYFHQADNSAIGGIDNIYSKTSLGTSVSLTTGINVRYCNTTDGTHAIYLHVVESGGAQATGAITVKIWIDYQL